MSDNTNPYNFGAPQKQNNDNARKLLTVAGIVIALLLGVIGYLLVNKASLQDAKAQTEQKLSEEQQLKLDLQKQFDDANLELEELKAKSATLEGDITKYQSDLKAQKARIESLLGDSRNLKKAREELENLKASYASKIAELTAQVDQLTAANATLTTEKTQLQTDLSAEKTARQEVIAQKEQVTAEKAKVEEERTHLSKKVDIASLVRVSDITAVGFNVKDSGKEVKKNYAKNIERLKVCISLGQNDIVAAGRETFYVRIITPTGESLSTASQGGGILNTNKGEQVPYSFTKDVEYNNDAMNVCIPWDPGQALKKGNYDVEVYNKGFLAGRGTFTLK